MRIKQSDDFKGEKPHLGGEGLGEGGQPFYCLNPLSSF
jgi:hypothetical protein